MGPPSLQATSSRATICISIPLNNPGSQGFGISSSQRDPTPGHQGHPLTLAFCLPAPLFADKLWAFSQYHSHPAEETGASSGQPPHAVSVLVTRASWGRLGAGVSVVWFHSQSAFHDPGPCSYPRSWRETRTGPCPPGTQHGKGGASHSHVLGQRLRRAGMDFYGRLWREILPRCGWGGVWSGKTFWRKWSLN